MMRWALGFIVLVSSLTVVGSSGAATVHAISFTKSCTSPVNVGAPYTCSFGVQNNVDESQDTLQITGLSDVVHASGGNMSSPPNFLSFVGLIFGGSGTVTCVGGSGGGTAGNPYIGATSCTLTFGATVQTTSFSYYNVTGGDYTLPNHTLTDTATLTWNNTCTFPGDTCTTANQTKDAQGSAVVQQLQSSTATTIHDTNHQPVTAVPAGTVVHDFASVTGQSGQPIPTGNVLIERFPNRSCTGAAANSTTVTLAADGTVDAVNFTYSQSTATFISFRATYIGDATYAGSIGACETLNIGNATAVQVASLRATPKKSGVLVRWRMGTEVGVLGYNVYRERKGVRIRLNRAIIRARGGVAGGSYSYLDKSARRPSHSVRYWLEVRTTGGSRVWKVTRTP
jgi:hypothetical protein